MKPNFLKHFLVLFVFFLATFLSYNCQTINESSSKTNDSITTTNTTPKIVNLGENFKEFWAKAKGKPFNEQIKIWDQIVEKPYQSFYDQMVWQKKDRPDWQDIKNKRLREFFSKYNDRYSDIAKSFDTFNQTVEYQLKQFKAKFSGTDLSVVVWAVPSPTFNGQVGSAPEKADETIMAVGIDMTVLLGSEVNSLFAHELFHVLHQTKLDKIVTDKERDEAKLTEPLFKEGFATYISGVLNPTQTDDILLMSDDLAKISVADMMWLAKRFLEQANEKAFDERKPDIYRNWFSRTGKIRNDLPTRCGYALGLKVMRKLVTTNKIEDMLTWNFNTIHSKVIEALKPIAKGPGAR